MKCPQNKALRMERDTARYVAYNNPTDATGNYFRAVRNKLKGAARKVFIEKAMYSNKLREVWKVLRLPETFFMRGFRFRSSLKKWPARKASGPERHPLDSAEPITHIPEHPESGCSADWFPGDIECFKCSDWITITIGAWSERGWFEGDKDQIQIIQAQITYVFTFWDMKN